MSHFNLITICAFFGGRAGEQSTTCQFSPSTMWVLGIKLALPLGNMRLYLLSHLTHYLFMSLHKLNLQGA